MESKRTEKLASALYLLTSFFDDKEPMKWRLRELGGKLISLQGNGSVALEIIGLLTVAKNAGLISDANYQIVYKEFSSIAPQGQTLGEIFRRIEEREEYKAIEEPRQPEARVTPNQSEKSAERQSLYMASSLPKAPVVKDRTPKETPKEGVVAIKKNSRQSVILTLLKKKKEIMIKDVSPLIDGVSEKTIQRELLSMVNNGILKKEGEKRWSRYSLAE